MIHHRKDPRKVTRAYAYAAVAKAEGAELIYFSPGSIDYDHSTIRGYVYESGEWKWVITPFPAVIYNAGSPEKMAESKAELARLSKEIPFTSFSIGNKMSVYKRLKRAGTFSKYLIPSESVFSCEDFLHYLDLYDRVIFKPVSGHKGQDVILVERNGDNFHLQIDGEHYYYNYSDLHHFITRKTAEEKFMIQPYISCKTKTGCTYDFRLHVQKNGEGRWVITAIYPRIGAPGSIITNISKGGSSNNLVLFLKQEFGDEYYNMKQYLEQFSLHLAAHLDSIQQEYFAETLDELGIDVGLDESGKICIYEVNWRPGCPPLFDLELDIVRNSIRYAMHLAKKRQQNQEIDPTEPGQ